MLTFPDFTLISAKAECPACSKNFNTSLVSGSSPATADTRIETDLHRVYSCSAFRAAAIGLCMECGYSWWLKSFVLKTFFCPDQELQAPTLSSSSEDMRRFATAYLCGKQHKANHLELALVAMNAEWCAQDAGMEDQRWLNIAREELTKALRNPSARIDRGFYHYLLGEMCRRQDDFKGALANFDKARAGARLPEELILRQRVQARSGDASKTLLPVYLIESLFCPAYLQV
ncbi:MAG: DUF2225 domain-containing protein [Candidatus Obscuribacterales bacterium]|nr:DUF2225 domain-containing protein [Candidatus Obscuribacterales bacterium]